MSSALSEPANFAEIEKLLQSLAIPTKPTDIEKTVEERSNSLRKPTTTAPLPNQDDQFDLIHKWGEPNLSDATPEKNESVSNGEPSKKKRKTSNRNDTKKKITTVTANRKTALRKTGTAQKKTVPEDSLSTPDTCSEDNDSKDFLEQLKNLTEQKKKVRANASFHGASIILTRLHCSPKPRN